MANQNLIQRAPKLITFLLGKKNLISLGLLWLGSFVGRGSTFLIYIILARELGPDAFGIFSSAMATIMIFALLGGFGIPHVWLKVFGLEGWSGIRWVKPSLSFVLITLIVIIFIIFTITQIQPEEDKTNMLLTFLFFFLCGYVGIQLVSSKLQLEERYRFITVLQFMPNITRLVLICACFYLFGLSLTLFEVALIYALIGLVITVWCIKQLIMMSRGEIKLKGHDVPKEIVKIGPSLIEVIKVAWPFGFAGFFAFIYIQSDIVIIKYLVGNDQAGYYSVAFTIFSAVMSIPMILFSKFLIPKYHRWVIHDKVQFYKTYKKGNFAMLLSGIGIFLFLMFFSNILITSIFGVDYLPSVDYVRILAFTVPFSFLSESYGAALMTGEFIKLRVKVMGIVALLNIISNFVLIPFYGAIGAAFSTLFCYIVLMLLYKFYSNKKVFTQRSQVGQL